MVYFSRISDAVTCVKSQAIGFGNKIAETFPHSARMAKIVARTLSSAKDRLVAEFPTNLMLTSVWLLAKSHIFETIMNQGMLALSEKDNAPVENFTNAVFVGIVAQTVIFLTILPSVQKVYNDLMIPYRTHRLSRVDWARFAILSISPAYITICVARVSSFLTEPLIGLASRRLGILCPINVMFAIGPYINRAVNKVVNDEVRQNSLNMLGGMFAVQLLAVFFFENRVTASQLITIGGTLVAGGAILQRKFPNGNPPIGTSIQNLVSPAITGSLPIAINAALGRNFFQSLWMGRYVLLITIPVDFNRQFFSGVNAWGNLWRESERRVLIEETN